MVTWLWGRGRLAAQRATGALPLATLIETLRPDRPARVPGTAIYMTARIDNVPAALLHNMKHNKVLHERNVLMTVRTEDVPQLPEAERLEIAHLGQNFHTVTIHYGFLEEPDIPRALALCRVGGFRFNLMETSFFVGREKIVARRRSGIMLPFKKLFITAVEHGARRHRVLPHPGQPHRRARRPGRALGRFSVRLSPCTLQSGHQIGSCRGRTMTVVPKVIRWCSRRNEPTAARAPATLSAPGRSDVVVVSNHPA